MPRIFSDAFAGAFQHGTPIIVVPFSKALSGLGVVLRREGVALGMVRSVRGITEDGPPVDQTNYESPEGWMEFRGGLKSASLEVQINFNPNDATYLNVRDDYNNQVVSSYQLVMPPQQNKRFTFEAFPSKLDTNSEPRAAITATLALQVTGAVVLEDGN